MKNKPLYDVRPISNLKEMLESSTTLFSDKSAFWVKKSEEAEYSPVSYKEFKADVDYIGTALCNAGLKGKRIALMGENRYEWAVSYLAIVNGTGIAVPIDKELPENEVENLLIRSSASAVIYSGKNAKTIENISARNNNIVLYINMDLQESSERFESFSHFRKKGAVSLDSGNTDFIQAKIDNNALSMLLFTSATTSESKAVMLSHTNICANLTAMCSMLNIESSDIFLSILPIHHAYECTCGFLCPIYRGASIAHFEGLRHIPKNLKESRATVVLGVPLIFETMYKKIIDHASQMPGGLFKLKFGCALSDFLRLFGINITGKLFAAIHDTLGGHVRLLISGAAAIDPKVSKAFRSFGFGFLQGYGLTECSPIVALNRDVDFKDDAAGLPLPGLKVAIDEKNADGIGEIIVKGPSIMSGYYENDKANAAAFKNGWFHTGDLGYLDKDNFLHITGRKKNVIVTRNGKNIFPEEIETMLNRGTYIKESLVYGKHDPASSNQDDFIITAAIVPDMEKIAEEFNSEEINDDFIKKLIKTHVKTVNGNLVSYKHIKDIVIRENEFAKTTTKKIKRYMETQKEGDE